MSWSIEDKRGFIQHSQNHIGQINRGTPLGDVIYVIVKEYQPSIIYDIGCWNGEGTTKCITQAITDSGSSSVVYGFEVNVDKYNHTFELYKRNPHVHIIHGTIKKVGLDEILAVFPHVGNDPTLIKWSEDDLKNSASSNLFQPHDWIDLVIHDGGEWDSYFIYRELKNRVGSWILDDIFTDKNKLVHDDLMNDPDYVHVGGGADRNGWSYFRRKDTITVKI